MIATLNYNIINDNNRIIVSKKNLIVHFLIVAFYFSAYAQFIMAIIGMYLPSQKLYFILLTQGFLYVSPLLFFFYLPIGLASLLILLLISFYILHIPVYEMTDITQTFLGVKNFFLILFYLPLIHNVYKDKVFRYKLEKAFNVVFASYAVVTIFEVISIGYTTDLYEWFRSLAGVLYQQRYDWRPYGLSLTIHMQGFVLAIGSLYSFFKKKKLLFFVCFTGLLMSTVKTWIIAFGVTSLLYGLFNFSFSKTLVIYSFMLITIIPSIMLIISNNIWDYYAYRLISGYSNPGENLMFTSIGKFRDFIPNGIFPNGFSSRGGLIITRNFNDSLPAYYLENEVFLYDMIFQLGFVMTGLWGFIIWRHLLSRNNGILFKNQYKTLLFMSLFALVHTSSVQVIFIFITVMYFSESHKLSRKVI